MTLFRITRTSVWAEDVPPCNECKKKIIDRVDRRTFKTFEEHDARCTPPWLFAGTDHKVVDGGIERTFKNAKTVWTREFETIEDLVQFTKAQGGEVVISSDYTSVIPALEIYDDYRE